MALLAESRAQGLSFEAAWVLAVRPGRAVIMTNSREAPDSAVRWPSDSNDRIAWRAAVIESKDAWRRAYERRPCTRRETAVLVLLEVLTGAPARGMRPVEAIPSAA